MDDAVPGFRSEEYSIVPEEDQISEGNLIVKHQKPRFTSIVHTSEILSEAEIRREPVHPEPITSIQQNESSAKWEILSEVCSDLLTCLQWLAKRRLISNTYICPKCSQNCTFQPRRDRTDKYNWTCNPCNFKKSLREGSFFAGSHLSLPTILQLINLWTLKTRHEVVQDQLCIKQRHTIVDWFAFIREICARKVLDTPHHIGGLHEDTLEGIVVYFDILNFTHLRNRIQETYWVVLGIESGTDRYFVVPIDTCQPAAVALVLRQFIEPGTILIGRPFENVAATNHPVVPEELITFSSDYSVTLDLKADYPHLASSFYDIEETELWKLIRRRYKSKSDLYRKEATSTSLFQSYIQEALWRRMNSDSEDLFSVMIADIGHYYPV
ncbi:uncharacterized protein LOC129263642 isoform X1 [Lytechinus pictus]|uniref:uncharacterized protein LOC129263642 isoform X1 n=1 Tax=Lytechinus pictus TaxID=7653 RepID=UPI0030B9DBD2